MWRDGMRDVERYFPDVTAGIFPAWGGFVNSVSPFGPMGNRVNRITDGSEIQFYDRTSIVGYFNLRTIEVLNQHHIFNAFGVVYEADILQQINDFQDLFNTIAMEESAKFITGLRPLNQSEWDSYVEVFRGMGLDEYETLIKEGHRVAAARFR
jgi:hypothetical protein